MSASADQYAAKSKSTSGTTSMGTSYTFSEDDGVPSVQASNNQGPAARRRNTEKSEVVSNKRFTKKVDNMVRCLGAEEVRLPSPARPRAMRNDPAGVKRLMMLRGEADRLYKGSDGGSPTATGKPIPDQKWRDWDGKLERQAEEEGETSAYNEVELFWANEGRPQGRGKQESAEEEEPGLSVWENFLQVRLRWLFACRFAVLLIALGGTTLVYYKAVTLTGAVSETSKHATSARAQRFAVWGEGLTEDLLPSAGFTGSGGVHASSRPDSEDSHTVGELVRAAEKPEGGAAKKRADNSSSDPGGGECPEGKAAYSVEQGRRPNDSCCEAYHVFGGRSEEPDYAIYDLKNVAVQGDTLHIYDPGQEAISVLEAWGYRLPRLTYKWGGVQSEGMPVVVHEGPLEKSMCPVRSTGMSFYLVPHFQENAFHLHNDNFMRMTSSILSTPCLCHGEELDSCNRYEKTVIKTPPLRQTHGHTNYFSITPSTWRRTNIPPISAEGRLHCLDHMVWGYVKPYYMDCQGDRSSTTWAWQHFALKQLGIHSPPPPSQIPLVPPAPPTGAKPRVLFLRRNAITKGRDKTDRFMRDLEPFRRAWETEGIHMDKWIYMSGDSLQTVLSALAGYDIYIGVHGAQLTNALYGTQGLVLVEVANPQWDKELFQRVAQARRGVYIKLRLPIESHFQVDSDMAGKAVRCALALWKQESSSVCDQAAANPGPARSFQPRPFNFEAGLGYYYEVGQS